VTGTRERDLVSVVTPCYNAAPFVAETVESVAAQRYRPVEHIVVDDGSSDASWDVIRSFGSRIRAERLPRNLGAAAARNRGLAGARGRFVMFLDADDLLGPEAIGGLVAALGERRDAVAMCEWRRLVQFDGAWRERPAEIALPAPDADLLRRWIESTTFVPPCALLWPRELFERVGGWDESLSLDDDTDVMLRALASGVRLVRAGGGRAYYRLHGDSRPSLSVQVFSEPRLASRRRVLDKLVLALERQGRLRGYACSLSLAYHLLALVGYQQGFPELARACQRRGEHLGGRQALSRTPAGRLLAWTLGLERKERIVQWLERRGIATAGRRRLTRLRRLHARHEEARGAA
jgi:O-antigen biosynthesis protein